MAKPWLWFVSAYMFKLLSCETWCPPAISVMAVNPVWTLRAIWRLKFDTTCCESGLRSHPAATITVFCPALHSHSYMHLHLQKLSTWALLKDTAKVGVGRVTSVTYPLRISTLLWEEGERGCKGGRRNHRKREQSDSWDSKPLDLFNPLTCSLHIQKVYSAKDR